MRTVKNALVFSPKRLDVLPQTPSRFFKTSGLSKHQQENNIVEEEFLILPQLLNEKWIHSFRNFRFLDNEWIKLPFPSELPVFTALL